MTTTAAKQAGSADYTPAGTQIDPKAKRVVIQWSGGKVYRYQIGRMVRTGATGLAWFAYTNADGRKLEFCAYKHDILPEH